MSAALKLCAPDDSSHAPLLRLYRDFLAETGEPAAAAIFAIDTYHQAQSSSPAIQVPTGPAGEPAYLTIKQAAKRLQVSERTIARMIDNGLRVTRAGKTVRIKPADLEQHLEEQDTRFD